MDDNDSRSTVRGRNLKATFRSEAEARDAAAALKSAGIDASVTFDTDEDRRTVMRAEMRDELESAVVGPGNVGPYTKSMMKGMVKWIPIATVVGAVLGAAIGILVTSSTSGAIISAIVGALAGATVAFSISGGLKSGEDREGAELDAEGGVTVGVRSDDESEVRRAAEILRARQPQRLDEVTPDGTPLGPSSDEKTHPVRGD